ncbi:MAG: hypothetical protein IJC76_08415 [Lachnospiraceae bacterium]|nr:hypothetical protein [Lachnospiraceae bacterium]
MITLDLGTFGTVMLIILAILVVAIIVLYILGKKAEKKQAEQKELMEQSSQTMSFYVIDKKRVKLKEAGLPKIVLEQTPKYLRRAKLPIIKVKVGPRVMSLVCEEEVFKTILPKQEVKAQVSGIYVTSARRIRGPLPEPKKTKKELRAEKKAQKAKEKEKAMKAKQKASK